jgi:hypothetical protein
MTALKTTSTMSTTSLWTGRGLSAFAVMFLVFDGAIKVMRHPMVLEASAKLGFAPDSRSIVFIGLILLACTLLYAVPRTAIVGAVLLTGYLGGAVATQLRAGSAAFELVFPLIVGGIVWTGLVLQRAELAVYARELVGISDGADAGDRVAVH